MPNKRSRSKTALPRLSRDAERLVYLARSQDAAGSVVEFRFWDQPLRSEVSRLIEHNADQGIESALDFLFVTEAPGFDVLLEAVESQSEAPQLEGQQLLLVAAPILAWSKYSIFSGTLRRELQQSLEAALRDQVVATGAAVALAPYIFSIDQLPRRFSEVNNWTRALGARALGRESKLSLKNLPETIALLADTRFLIAAIAAPIGEPLFRWQEKPSGATPANREQILERWRAHSSASLASALPGCALDVLIPDGYHVATRESDSAIRPYSIHAALAFLEHALTVPPAGLRAIVAPFGDKFAQEYRIGFTLKGSQEVLHGVVWPLFAIEETNEQSTAVEAISELLEQCGLGELLTLDSLFPLEFCDDCGAPLFADPLSDLVHAELPENGEPVRAHLH